MTMIEEQNQTLQKQAGCAKINTFGMIFLKNGGQYYVPCRNIRGRGGEKKM